MNPILLGQAIEIPAKVRKAVKAVLDREGIWIATDTKFPEAVVPLASMGRKVYSMKIDKELDPERFLKTVVFEGPYPKRMKAKPKRTHDADGDVIHGNATLNESRQPGRKRK